MIINFKEREGVKEVLQIIHKSAGSDSAER